MERDRSTRLFQRQAKLCLPHAPNSECHGRATPIAQLDPAEPVRRYERERPGELTHRYRQSWASPTV